MARQFLKRSVKRGGNQVESRKIFSNMDHKSGGKIQHDAKTEYLNHKLKSEEIRSTMLEAVSGTGKGTELG